MSDRIQKELEELAVLEKQTEERANDEKQAEITALEEIDSRWKKIREEVRRGKSTGDPIRDFVISAYGRSAPQIEDKFRSAQELCSAYPGEFILMIQRQIDTSSPIHDFPCFGHDFPKPEFTRAKIYLSLAAIQGPITFNIPEERYCFSTGGKYVQLEAYYGDPILFERDLAPYIFSDNDLGLFLNEPLLNNPANELCLEIIAGDRNIIRWLRGQTKDLHHDALRMENLFLLPFYKMCVLLKRFLSFPEQTVTIMKESALLKLKMKELKLEQELLNHRLKYPSEGVFKRKRESGKRKKDQTAP